MNADLLRGDCLDVMRTLLPDNSVDAIVTDPPYGLQFMGKQWDYDVPSAEVWAECLRVLKPGGHLLAFAGTRTQHRVAVNIEDAGFEIRDMIAWVYGSGFPKSHNGEWGGTALKPALEPITLARKPLVGTVEQNWRAHGTGTLAINGCRVPTDDNLNGGAYAKNGSARADDWGAHNGFRRNQGLEFEQPSGRWPRPPARSAPPMTNRLRDHMKAAAGALLFAAAVCAALGLEARVTGQTVGDMHIATAQPCYCSETCE